MNIKNCPICGHHLAITNGIAYCPICDRESTERELFRLWIVKEAEKYEEEESEAPHLQ